MLRRRVVLGLALLPLAPAARGRAMRAGARDLAGQSVGQWAHDTGFAGVVAIGRAGRIARVDAFGLASIERGSAATSATRYAIGSVSKWLTSAAVLRLCDTGRLSLDAPIRTYLPALPGRAGSDVSLAHLLSNSSGIPDRLAEAARTDPTVRSSQASAAEAVRRYVTGELAFAPGSRFDYTVLNWVVVRALLEEVTGRPFAALMRRVLLEPAGIAGIGIVEEGFADVPGLAAAYRGTHPPVRSLEPVPRFAAASGTFYARAPELVTAAHRIFGPRLLSPASRAAMLRVRVPGEDYALGGRVRQIDGRLWAWETGKIGGYRSHVAHRVDDDRTIVVLGNVDTEQRRIEALVERLARAT